MMDVKSRPSSHSIPDFFRPVLWSYDFLSLDALKDKKTIIVNTINYGDWRHWRWVAEQYGEDGVREILVSIPFSTIRPPALKLASIVFSFTDFNYAPRGTQ